MHRRSLWILPAALFAAVPALAQPAPPAAPDQPAPAPAAAPADAAPAPAPAAAAPAEPAPPPAAPKKLGIFDDGFFQPGLNLQFWACGQNPTAIGPINKFNPAPASCGSADTTFLLRRAEIKASGQLIPKTVAYTVMFDVAKIIKPKSTTVPVTDAAGQPVAPAQQVTVANALNTEDTSPLQDFYITWLTDYAEVSGGQFKIPVSWEGSNSATKLIMPERSIIGHVYGDKRDIGVRVEKTFKHFYYMVGAYNGAGKNTVDNNNQKDLALRLEAYPVEGVMVGGAVYGSVGQQDQRGTKRRYEGDFRFDKYNVLLQFEYIYGKDKAANGEPFTNSNGLYGAAGYTLLEHLQPVVRIGFFDPNLRIGGDRVVEYDGGVNYYFKGNNLKLQASFSDFHPQVGKDGKQGILAAQLTF